MRKGTAPAVGSFVELKARLQPPLAPLRPGSYDFGRDMYFAGHRRLRFCHGRDQDRGAARSAAGCRCATPPSCRDLRDAIDARIRTTLDGDKRAIATALLTGRRDAITTPVNDAMFISGLGHVLSISGYHMAVVAGVVFFAVRALLALIPRADRQAFRSRNGRPPQRLPPPPSICCCPAPRSRPSARSS